MGMAVEIYYDEGIIGRTHPSTGGASI